MRQQLINRDPLRVLILEPQGLTMNKVKAALAANQYVSFGVANMGEALQLMHATEPDILLFDLHTTARVYDDGQAFAEMLRKKMGLPVVFLAGADDDYTWQYAYAAKADSILLKPFQAWQVHFAVQLALERFAVSTVFGTTPYQKQDFIFTDRLFLKVNGLFVRVKLGELMFVEAHGSYTIFHTHAKQYVQSYNLFAVQSQLTQIPNQFVRVHRSYLVNADHVSHFDKHHLVVGGHKLPIGKTYKSVFMECLKHCIVS